MRLILESLTPYRVKSNEGFIRLDNNESFMNLLTQIPLADVQASIEINRYPSDAVEGLIQAYAQYARFPKQNILAGNGSDEWISLICQFALDPGDKVIVIDPDFSMYEKNARILGASVRRIDLNDDFSLPIETLVKEIYETEPTCVFLSNPNNPTGRFYSTDEIMTLVKVTGDVKGYFILDEAYIEFARQSYAEVVLEHDHVIILRTASKALGMAGLRLGFLLANERFIEDISRIKPPYNVNQFSATVGALLLSRLDFIQESLLKQKEQIQELESILKEFVEVNEEVTLYPSETNFFLLEMDQAKQLYEFLYVKKIKVRFFGSGRLKNGLRISTGTKEDTVQLRQSLQEWSLR